MEERIMYPVRSIRAVRKKNFRQGQNLNLARLLFLQSVFIIFFCRNFNILSKKRYKKVEIKKSFIYIDKNK